MDQVLIFDTTLRDGEQTPGVSFHLKEKLEIARALDKMGVNIIEAGFAGASPGDFSAIQAVCQTVTQATLCSLARCVKSDIVSASKALETAGRKRIHVFIATSPLHMEHKLHMTPDQVLLNAIDSVKLARELCDDVEFSCEDATRSELHFLYEIIEKAIEAGATTINVPDTVGYATVEEYSNLFKNLKDHVPNIHQAVLSAHCHNDLGLAVATSLAAVTAGARQVECTLNGLGERAGNAPLEEVVMGLRTRRDYYSCDTGIVTKRIYKTSRLIANLAGVEIPPNKAVVGSNAFAHQSGIHQHGVLQNRATYEVMSAEDLGVPQSSMVLGKLSGRHALKDRAEQLGYELSEEDLAMAFVRFKELADRKKEITDRDIMALMREQRLITKNRYQLCSFQIFSGNQMTSTATVTMSMDDQSKTRAACGDGPVEACFNAVDLITKLPCKLESYNIKAVTEGQDALGEVTVRVSRGEVVMLGKGVSPDIIEASCLAYVNAVNRMLSHLEDDVDSKEV